MFPVRPKRFKSNKLTNERVHQSKHTMAEQPKLMYLKAYPPAGYLVLAAPPASLLLSLPSDWCLVARSSVGSATLPGSCAECYLAAQVEK